MKTSDTFTKASLLIGSVSLLTSIVTGLAGAYIASVSALTILVLSWGIWATVIILKLETEVSLSSDKAAQVGTCSTTNIKRIAAVIPYEPLYTFLEDSPEIINTPKDKIKIPADFLEKDSFTMLLWAEITDEFLASSTNRYLFAYTTDPKTQSAKTHEYPNAFFLGILGGTLNWRFVIKGPNPVNETTVTMSTSKVLCGWKLFAVTWNLPRKSLSFTVDAGKVFREEKTLGKENIQINIAGHLFHLGGWLDSWPGGMALLKFFRFRVFERSLTVNEIRDIYECECKTMDTIN